VRFFFPRTPSASKAMPAHQIEVLRLSFIAVLSGNTAAEKLSCDELEEEWQARRFWK
jgi:predicted DNA-binding protein (UPF0251 family)